MAGILVEVPGLLPLRFPCGLESGTWAQGAGSSDKLGDSERLLPTAGMLFACFKNSTNFCRKS
jgi:hypothetical protein